MIADGPRPILASHDRGDATAARPAPVTHGTSEGLVSRLQLAELALGTGPGSMSTNHASIARHLAFLPTDALDLDLDDPLQRFIGDYELIEKLGSGGMGVVYRARQNSLQRDVALKLLAAGPWASREYIERFRREAQAAARMQHPNIVPIFEVGALDDINYFSMQIVRGASLAATLARDGAMAPRRAAALLRTVAEAVDYAHRLGMLHLDLKPGNVLLDESGEPHVADFGLARAVDDALTGDSDEVSGTPSYMAPEQALLSPHRLSPATDVYGLGAILYETLTGRPPFLERSPRETLQQLGLGAIARPRSLRPEVPEDLEAICLKCLARNPPDRYPTARMLADDLACFIEGRAVSVRPLNPLHRMARWARREPRLATAVVVAALALLLGAATATMQWQRAEHAAARARAALWQDRIDAGWVDLPGRGPTAVLPAMVTNLAGQEAVGSREEALRTRARIGALGALAPRLIDVLPGVGAVSAVALADDGDWVASMHGDRFVIHDVASGAERCHGELQQPTVKFWSGQYFGELRPIGDGHRILAVRLRSGVPPRPSWEGSLIDVRNCTRMMPPVERFGPAPEITWSDGATHAIVRRDAESSGELLRVSDWATLARVDAPPMRGNTWLLAPGLANIVVARDEWRVLDVLEPRTLASRHRYVHGAHETLRASAWSRDGRLLALAFAGGDVLLLDPGTGVATTLSPRGDAEPYALAFDARDGVLAASFLDGSVRSWDVRTRQTLSRPVHIAPGKSLASPAPSGERMFVVDQSSAQLWSLAGRNREPALLWRQAEGRNPFQAMPAAWNPGLGLLATGNSAGELRLWRARPPLQVAPGHGPPLAVPGCDPPFDGRHVVEVDGANVSVFDLDRGTIAGPPMALPQAVSFAVLADDPPRLVASAGDQLHVRDWRTGQPSYDPVVLPASPTMVALVPAARAVLVAHSAHVDARNITVLETYLLATGQRTGRVELDGLHRDIGISRDGRRVVVALAGTVRLFDVPGLHDTWPALRIGADALAAMRAHYATSGPLQAPTDEVVGAQSLVAIDAANGTLWISIWHGDSAQVAAGAPRGELLAVDAGSGRIEARKPIDSPVASLRALPHDRVALVDLDHGELRIVAHDGTGQSIALGGADSHALVALSADGGRLAVAQSRGAVVFDSESGQWLSPPLTDAIAGDDRVTGISLDHAGSTLLLRTMDRRWARYALVGEDRSLADIEKAVRAAQPRQASRDAAQPVQFDRATRAALRRADPGPPAPAPTRTTTPMPVLRQEVAAQPRAPQFVDLAPACTRQPSDPALAWAFVLERVLPQARHRLLGIDFDVRCAVRTSMYAAEADVTAPRQLRSRAIPLAIDRVAAIELLIAGETLYHDLADVPYAWIELAYRDGGKARMPIVYRRQIMEHWQSTPHGGDGRVAYYAASSREATDGFDVPTLFAVRIDNPHPQRRVGQMVLEAVDRAWSTPLLLAATLVPLSAEPAGVQSPAESP